MGSLRSYHQLDNGQFDALRFIYEKNNQGKFGNGKNGNYGQSSQNAWIINDGVGTQVKKIELHSNRDNVIGEIELLMDGNNIISQAKITDISGKREFKKFVDGNFDAFKSSPNLKIEFPTSQSIQFLCIHGHHNATIKFYDHKNILIHEAKLTSKRRLDTSTVALPSVHTIDIIAAQYWETHGNQVKIREVNSSGKWQPHSNHIKPNFLISFNNQKTKKGQHLVLEQKYLDRNDGPPAKFKVQFAHGPEVVAQASLDKNVLNIAKKVCEIFKLAKRLAQI